MIGGQHLLVAITGVCDFVGASQCARGSFYGLFLRLANIG
jgi:hypothetical protein